MRCQQCWMEVDSYDVDAGSCYNCGRPTGEV